MNWLAIIVAIVLGQVSYGYITKKDLEKTSERIWFSCWTVLMIWLLQPWK